MCTKQMSNEELFSFFMKDAEQPFFGWDFSYINNRMITSNISWSYSSEILPYVRTVSSMLDMGTGGGEFLYSIQPLPKKTHATEAYEPNVPIAKKKLEPIGVKVNQIFSDNKLPYENNYFDLVINRHEFYLINELKRVLKPNGIFITQQVWGNNDLELNKLLGYEVNEKTHEFLHWNLKYAVNELETAGFEIIKQKEEYPKTRFFDIGALLFYIKACPWQVPDFTLDNCLDKIKEIHEKIIKDGYIEVTSGRFIVKARKSK